MEPVGYQQRTCLCCKTEFVVGTISLHVNCIHFRRAVFIHVGLKNCVREIVFCCPCVLLWKVSTEYSTKQYTCVIAYTVAFRCLW